MNHDFRPEPRRFHANPGRRGVALIIVLGIVVLIAAVVVDFLLRSGSELKSVSSYRAATNARQLSDVAVNLVQAQINDATTQGSDKAWASQPGAIRVFNSTGVLQKIYRLYSADRLTADSAASLDGDVPAASWSASPALWTDLNEPVTLINGTGATQKQFPILDPRSPSNANATLSVSGFVLSAPPGAITDAANPKYQPAPMPVRWLYVLQNGDIVAPSGAGRLVTVAGASVTNPIVGRIAFWTDDETCKININTASDGTFWDSPRFSGIFTDEANLTKNQPATKEFQAYPGHPATTSLRPFLNELGAGFAPSSSSGTGITSNFFKLLPRYNDDYGSKGGTVNTTAITQATSTKSDRFYTSVGELLFDSQRSNSSFTRAQLESARFFLTASSRAPEVNLFGRPRVSIWPTYSTATPNSDSHLTVTDKLIAFCSSINSKAYYFSRIDSKSRTTDISLPRNAALLRYLDDLTSRSIPGFNGSLQGRYTAIETRQILTEIFDYVRIVNLTDNRIAPAYQYTPSYSGNVAPSYKSDWQTQGLGRFPVLSEVSLVFIGCGQGNVLPTASGSIPVDSQQTPTYSMGLSGTSTPPDGMTAVQAFVLFSFFNPSAGNPGINPEFSLKIEGLNQLKINGDDLRMTSSGIMRHPAGFVPGYSANNASSVIDYRASLAFIDNSTPSNIRYYYCISGNAAAGSSLPYPFASNIINVQNYDKVTKLPITTMTLSGGPVTLSLYSDAPPSGDPVQLCQQYAINMPSGSLTIPMPKVIPHDSTAGPWLFFSDKVTYGNAASAQIERNMGYNQDTSPACTDKIINSTYDSVLSFVPDGIWSDYRMIGATPCAPTAAAASVTSDAFKAHPSAGVKSAFSLRLASNQFFLTGATSSGNLNGVALGSGTANIYPGGWRPIVSPYTTANLASAGGAGSGCPGDWDNVLYNQQVGPTINKVDEGTINYGNQNAYTQRNTSLFSPNRMVPSPVVFGSLPTGVMRKKPWQTLLFRPEPPGHPGADKPRDHLFLDLFWMPIAEPYAISEPFSTQGKINLNYQIVPFNYITRNVALRAVLANEKVARVKVSSASGSNARVSLNLDESNGTLRQFKEKFGSTYATGDVFKSASEICDIYLVPQGKAWTSDATAQADWYGTDFEIVGDNTRERPYATIYPRVTTKSNTYTVYFTVQALKTPANTTNFAQWDEDKGVVQGVYRGSTTLERYLDLNDTSIPDFASNPSTTSTLDQYYRWRVIANHQFP